MQHFKTSYFPEDLINANLTQLSCLLSNEEQHKINNLLWSNDGYKPDVFFSMAYTNNSILLKYSVREEYLSAIYRNINDPVYKDSCVELFIAFGNEDNYYNLEFNCLGTALVGYGSKKNDRINIDRSIIQGIKSYSYIKTSDADEKALINWELTLNIPFSVFKYNSISSLTGSVCRVNFYKCGDDLPIPHFLSWNNIINPHPDFHQPEFFGQVSFV